MNAARPISQQDVDRLLSTVTHDLREPLRAIRGFGDLLEREAADRLDERGERFLELIQQGAARMDDLLDGLSRYTRAARAVHEPAVVDLGEVLDAVLERMAGRIAERGARVARGDLPAVHADRAALEQVLEELVANALQFSDRAQPAIRVSAAATGAGWEIAVEDDGAGIAPRDRERAFDLFSRLHPRETHAGVGAGLAVCRRVAERHGGRVAAADAPGGGLAIRLFLPAEQENAR